MTYLTIWKQRELICGWKQSFSWIIAASGFMIHKIFDRYPLQSKPTMKLCLKYYTIKRNSVCTLRGQWMIEPHIYFSFIMVFFVKRHFSKDGDSWNFAKRVLYIVYIWSKKLYIVYIWSKKKSNSRQWLNISNHYRLSPPSKLILEP